MRSLLAWSQKTKALVLGIALIVLGFGIQKVFQHGMEALPELSATTVEIQTEALGLSANEVEQMITVPLEADLLNGVPWLKNIRSNSIDGLSSIQLIFDPGTDVMNARQMVQERLTQAHALPQVSKPPVMLPPLSSASRIMAIAMSSKQLSPISIVGAGALDRAAAPHGHSGRRQCIGLGRAKPRAPGADRPAAPEPGFDHPAGCHQEHRRGLVGIAAQLP